MGMMSMFSDSKAPRNFTTFFEFSLVMVQPKSARAVMLRLEKITDRG